MPKPILNRDIASCRRFDTQLEAESHACKTSKEERETRHVIKTGDHFFSSTTAQIYFYERLILTYSNGARVNNYLNDKDL